MILLLQFSITKPLISTQTTHRKALKAPAISPSVHCSSHSADYLQSPFLKSIYFKCPVTRGYKLFFLQICKFHGEVQLCSAFWQYFKSWKTEGEKSEDICKAIKRTRRECPWVLHSRTQEITPALVCFALIWLFFFERYVRKCCLYLLRIDQWSSYCSYISREWHHDLWRHLYLEKCLSKYSWEWCWEVNMCLLKQLLMVTSNPRGLLCCQLDPF